MQKNVEGMNDAYAQELAQLREMIKELRADNIKKSLAKALKNELKDKEEIKKKKGDAYRAMSQTTLQNKRAKVKAATKKGDGLDKLRSDLTAIDRDYENEKAKIEQEIPTYENPAEIPTISKKPRKPRDPERAKLLKAKRDERKKNRTAEEQQKINERMARMRAARKNKKAPKKE